MAWRLRFPRGARPLDEHMDLKYAFSSSKLTRRCWSSATTARWASGGGIGGAPSGAFSRLRRTMRWRYLCGDASRRGRGGRTRRWRLAPLRRHRRDPSTARKQTKRTRPRAARRPAGSGRARRPAPASRRRPRGACARPARQSTPSGFMLAARGDGVFRGGHPYAIAATFSQCSRRRREWREGGEDTASGPCGSRTC